MNKNEKRIKKNLELLSSITPSDPMKKVYLYTEWWFLDYFKIYTSFEDYKLITTRRIIDGDVINMFNIDNVEREIIEYGENNNLNIKGISETISDIKKSAKGYFYTDTCDVSKYEKEFKDKKIKIIE